MSERLQEINGLIDNHYHEYKALYSNLSELTNSIKLLEDERSTLVESDGRRFLFKKTAVELKGFINYLKVEKWITLDFEGFDDVRKDIVQEAMLISMYCFQSNYSSPVKFVAVFDGFVNCDEYETLKVKYGLKFNYYPEGDSNVT